jgi:tripartite-type tricarboxylate transporter receptor subunit TctC
MDRRKVLKTAAAGAIAATGWPVVAQNVTAKIVVPYPAGGITDSMARLLALSMQKSLNQTVITENRPGAAGVIGTVDVKRAAPDGNTMLFHNSGMVAVQMLQRNATYDTVKDFEPVAMVANGPNFLMVHESVPAKTIPEFLDYAKSQSQGIPCANSGINSGGYLAALLLEKLANIKLLHVPFKGSAEVTNALVGGDVKMQLSVTTDSLNPFIKSGKIRLLGVCTKERTSLAPNIPSLSEFIPGYTFDGWYGILAPAKTPLARREQLAAVLKDALAESTLRDRFNAVYMEVIFKGPKEFGQMMQNSVDYFKNLIQLLKLTPE